MFDVTRKLFSFLDDRARIQFLLLLIPMLLTATLEMASIGMVLPLLHVLLGGNEDKILAWFPFLPLVRGEQNLIFMTMGFFAAFFVLKNIAILGMLYLITRFTQHKMAHFQQKMFDLYLRRPYTFHLQRNTAEIVRDLSNSISASFDGLRVGLNLIMDVFLAVAACALLLIIEPMVSLGIGAFLVVMGTIFYKFLAPLLHRWGERVFKLEAKIIQSINQGFGAIKDVKVLNCWTHLNRVFAEKTDLMATYLTKSITANQSPRLFVETLIIVGFMFVVMALLELRGSVEEVISIIGLFGMAALRLMPSMNRILSSMTEIRHRTAMVEALYGDLQDGQKDRDREESEGSSEALAFTNEIHLNGLSYSYQTAAEEKSALDNINLRIAKGESIGLVGPSGSGKTTLVNIFMCLLNPDSGQILVDGVDIRHRQSAWQHKLGLVPQHIYLLDDTLWRNIAFGVEDQDIVSERIAEVVRMAHLEDVVADLPQGLDTMLGEQGVRLSGGQRQRIGIARALYRDPKVLVFDEATSSLDNETEREVSRAIEEFSGKKTIIIIAHRLSTVRKCNRLVFMKNGSIVDVGGFDALMEDNADFQRMVQASDNGGEDASSESLTPI